MARHHVQKLTFAAISVVAIASGCNATPPAGEALVHVTKISPETVLAPPGQRQGQLKLTMGDEPAQPPEIRQALANLNQALQTMPIDLELATIKSSPNGKTLTVSKWRVGQSGPPTGVWIWPDWRNAANVIHVDDFSRANVLSNYYLDLLHYPNDGPGGSRVIDIRNPQHRFQFKGFKLHQLRVADNNRWACITAGGALVVGRLNPNDENWAQNVVIVGLPQGAEIETMMFRRNGTILVVDLKIGGNGVIKTYRLTDEAAIESASLTAYLLAGTDTVGEDAFFIVLPPTEQGVVKLATVAENGAMSVEEVNFNHVIDEMPAVISPSGKYVVTATYVWPPGGVRAGMRKTPKAAPGDTLPSFPVTPEGIGGGECWLAWD